LKLSVFLLFLNGFAVGGRLFVGYVWLSEHLRVKDLAHTTVAIFCVDALNLLVSSIYFQNYKNWTYIFGLPLIGVFFSIILTCLQFETPKYFHSKGEFDKARQILT
jgi:hypothetical protein